MATKSNMASNLKGSNLSHFEEKKSYEFFINDPQKNDVYDHENNTISTTKYNIITFLPKALLYQFMRYANIYFLVIAIVQLIKTISPLNPMTAVAPIIFVLFVSLVREAIEDYNRYLFDNENNNEVVHVYREDNWVEDFSGTLVLGEFVMVKQDQAFPADLILVDSNLPDGLCYIETATLDGEKTLKMKIANKITAGFFKNGESCKNYFSIGGFTICDLPNSNLYKFDGTIDLNMQAQAGSTLTNQNQNTVKISLSEKQLLLKGAVLKNTKWVVGYTVYTGLNTKLILNSKKPRQKMSHVENTLSKFILAILLLQVVLCIICAVANSVYYKSTVQYVTYMPPYAISASVDPVLSYFTYTLLLNTLIPISLIISLEIVKLVQGYFMVQDCELYSVLRDKYAKAGSISINEELGQVNYIFSDKTGTLTCNKMFFKYCVIGENCYEYNKIKGKVGDAHDDPDKAKIRLELDVHPIGSDFFEQILKGNNSIKDRYFKPLNISSKRNCQFQINDHTKLFEEYWKLISTCHECVCDEKDNGTREYSGLSPDDIELIRVASEQGFIFRKSESQTVRKVDFVGEQRNFEVLNVLEFTSDRKRMSIIIRDDNVIKLYMKGADTQVEKRLSSSSSSFALEKAKYYVDYFSKVGYRTLFVGMKVLDEEEYEEFSNKLKEASMDLVNKEAKVCKVMDDIEQGIYLLGATIVEDKLQDKVPDTIRDLRLAGIKIWMLTGDKMNTAYNIGLSCNLITFNLHTFQICGETGDKLDKLHSEYATFQSKNAAGSNQFAILIDAIALSTVLGSKTATQSFLDIAALAVAVICCRVSPLQKSQVVAVMKAYDPAAITLSIGDGGNDVSMIMEAHIGIGVYGEEGMRAVQASDFAIGEFKFLRKLLLFHGRINYLRITEMILYFFYKNFVLTILHFFYAFYNNASGQTIIDDWFISFYNLAFTAMPLLVRAILEQDLTLTDGEIVNILMPFLYKENRDSSNYNTKQFAFIIIRGFFQGLFCFMLNIYTLRLAIVDMNGNTADLWFNSLSVFTNVVFIASVRIIVIQQFNTIYNVATMIISSWVLYFLFVLYANYSNTFNSFSTLNVCYGSPLSFFMFFLNVNFAFLIDLISQSVFVLFNEQLAVQLKLEIKKNGPITNGETLPDLASQCYKEFENYSKNFKKEEPTPSPQKKINLKSMSEVDRLVDYNNLSSYEATKTDKTLLNNKSDLMMLNNNLNKNRLLPVDKMGTPDVKVA